MRAPTKVLLVAGGYVGAVLVALAAVAVQVAATAGPDRSAAAGMYAFGDSLLFLAAFSVAATAPTTAGLFFLRSRPGFWRGLSTAALAVAGTALPAPVLYYLVQSSWAALSVLRVLVAPPLALLWLLSALLAPDRGPRRLLLAALAIELVVFASVAARWIVGVVRGSGS